MQYRDIAMQQKKCRLWLRIVPRRIEVKKTYLSIAAAAFSIAGATAGFAAGLPTYETKGLPISAAEVRGLGAADGREQSQARTPGAPGPQRSGRPARPTRPAEAARPRNPPG